MGRRSLSSLGGCATANYRLRTGVEFLLRSLALIILRIGYTHLDGRGSRLAATHEKRHPEGVFFGGGAKVGRRSLSSLGGCATANYRLRTSVEFLLSFLALCVLRIGYTHLDGRGSRLATTHEKRHPEGVFFGGGAKGTRTPDLCVANASLYQLSYNPTRLRRVCAVIEFFGRIRQRLRS